MITSTLSLLVLVLFHTCTRSLYPFPTTLTDPFVLFPSLSRFVLSSGIAVTTTIVIVRWHAGEDHFIMAGQSGTICSIFDRFLLSLSFSLTTGFVCMFCICFNLLRAQIAGRNPPIFSQSVRRSPEREHARSSLYKRSVLIVFLGLWTNGLPVLRSVVEQ